MNTHPDRGQRDQAPVPPTRDEADSGEGRIRLQGEIPPDWEPQRFDQALALMFDAYSRSRLQRWIRDGFATVDGHALRPRDPVHPGQRLALDIPADANPSETRADPEDIDLDIVHADQDVIVVAKPPGLVVHPGAGNRAGTLLNALLHFDPALAALPRAGIVHRLDKGTSGLLVIARSLTAHTHLSAQVAARAMHREYLALVNGRVTAGGSVDAPIGRHATRRTAMAVVPGGREARTHLRIVRRLGTHTLLRLHLDTGRTHQIRVHMSHIGHPVTGDPLYGGAGKAARGLDAEVNALLRAFPRQALHAAQLGFEHPDGSGPVTFRTPLPADMAALIDALTLAGKEGP